MRDGLYVCLLVGFHGKGARALCWQVLASLAPGWRDKGYHTMTCEESHIGYQRYQHSDRESFGSSAESTICQSHQSSAPVPGQVGRQSEDHRQRCQYHQDSMKNLCI
jgi:hypothetical protein